MLLQYVLVYTHLVSRHNACSISTKLCSFSASCISLQCLAALQQKHKKQWSISVEQPNSPHCQFNLVCDCDCVINLTYTFLRYENQISARILKRKRFTNVPNSWAHVRHVMCHIHCMLFHIMLSHATQYIRIELKSFVLTKQEIFGCKK